MEAATWGPLVKQYIWWERGAEVAYLIVTGKQREGTEGTGTPFPPKGT